MAWLPPPPPPRIRPCLSSFFHDLGAQGALESMEIEVLLFLLQNKSVQLSFDHLSTFFTKSILFPTVCRAKFPRKCVSSASRAVANVTKAAGADRLSCRVPRLPPKATGGTLRSYQSLPTKISPLNSACFRESRVSFGSP